MAFKKRKKRNELTIPSADYNMKQLEISNTADDYAIC